MKVGFCTYPMLWQRTGGLQVQMKETISALRSLGCDAELFDTNRQRLGDFQLIHIFGAINGNEKIAEAARSARIPLVISSVLHPPFTRFDALRARLATMVTRRLTGWQFTTSYDLTRRAVNAADAVVALGEEEQTLLRTGYDVSPERISVVPNGISSRFQEAEGALFREHIDINGPFLLQVSSITPYKNPLASARAAAALDLPLVLIGQTPGDGEPYLEQCRDAAGGRLHYVGALPADSPLLPSAYAAAQVLLLPSKSEVMPLVTLEALAAGTPVVMTSHSSLELDNAGKRLQTFDPTDQAGFEKTIRGVVNAPPSTEECRDLVKHMTWKAVAEQLEQIYRRILASR
jgi:hypothetical protein